VGGLSDSVDSPRFATVVGLALYGAIQIAQGAAVSAGGRKRMSSPGVDRITQRVKTWLQDFF
jgi:cell division ATPase FtsA